VLDKYVLLKRFYVSERRITIRQVNIIRTRGYRSYLFSIRLIVSNRVIIARNIGLN
jgi:hypothetical protein